MIRSTSIWLIAPVIAAALLVTALFQLFGDEYSQEVVQSGPRLERQLSASPGQRGTGAANEFGQPNRSEAILSDSDLHQQILAMTEPRRNQILYLIIRDADAHCTEVLNSEYLTAESGVWHVHCVDANSYSVAIDNFGGTSVRPIPYEDVAPVIAIEPR